ncbi:MAG TPA: site-specific integrase [Candidatus Butyricimonas faecavium]|nr:site-specific integrase [Candidatus Butyricimonas faecavium]
MESNVFTIGLYCRRSRLNTKGEASLYLTLNQGDQRKMISLGLKLKIVYWDEGNKEVLQGCPNKGYYDLIIDAKKQEINKKIMAANLEGKVLSLDDFVEQQQKKEEEKKEYVKRYFEKYIVELEMSDRIKNARYYRCCMNCLMDFTNGIDVEFKSIDGVFLNDYATWMQVKKKLHKNTIGNRLRGLKAIFNRAISDKVISENITPFKEFKVSKYREETTKRAISKQDIERVINLDLKSISDEKTFPFYDFARDIFIFSYLGCGINIVDIAFLKYANIIDNDRLQFRRSKTKKIISFRLHPIAKEIIEKYRKKKHKQTDYVFPIFNDEIQKTMKEKYYKLDYQTRYVNKYLRKIGKHLNISLKLTSYVARHSFATVLKRSGVNTSIISEAMGHSSEKVTQVYLDSFENDQIDEAMSN